MHCDRFWHGGAYSRENLDAEEEREAEGRVEELGGVDVEVGDYFGSSERGQRHWITSWLRIWERRAIFKLFATSILSQNLFNKYTLTKTITKIKTLP